MVSAAGNSNTDGTWVSWSSIVDPSPPPPRNNSETPTDAEWLEYHQAKGLGNTDRKKENISDQHWLEEDQY